MSHPRIILLFCSVLLLALPVSLGGCLVPGPQDDYQASHPDGPYRAGAPENPSGFDMGRIPPPNPPR